MVRYWFERADALQSIDAIETADPGRFCRAIYAPLTMTGEASLTK
jgi:hypothetical protein